MINSSEVFVIKGFTVFTMKWSWLINYKIVYVYSTFDAYVPIDFHTQTHLVFYFHVLFFILL